MYTREQILSFPFRKHPYDRIFNRVKLLKQGCLEFQGVLDSCGYGIIKIAKHNLGAHRIAYILCKGDIPDNHVVMHSCDNPKCVNPEHLSTGTILENARDCVSKGRQGLRGRKRKL